MLTLDIVGLALAAGHNVEVQVSSAASALEIGSFTGEIASIQKVSYLSNFA